MDSIFSDLFENGVDAAISAVVLLMLVSVLSVVSTYNSAISKQDASVERMKEYREFAPYENTTVLASDIVSALYRYRGQPQVTVTYTDASGATVTTTWTSATPSTQYTTSYIYSRIDQSKTYQAVITYDANGAPWKITFTGG